MMLRRSDGAVDVLRARGSTLHVITFGMRVAMTGASLTWLFAASAFLTFAGCASQMPADHFAGWTDTQVFRQLGAHPDRDETYPATAVQPRFRVSVQRLSPVNRPESKNVMIREITWEHNGNDLVIVFYQRQGQWLALDGTERGRVVVE